MSEKPLIVSYYDGDSDVQCLSNFARTPFELDRIKYFTVEAFWQSLKFHDPIMRAKVASLTEGFDAKQMGQKAQGTLVTWFEYKGNYYKVGSPDHHLLLERAIRAKVAQNQSVRNALKLSGTRPLKHMLRSPYGTWRPGDSPSLPARTFENMLMEIREELSRGFFTPDLPLPPGIPKPSDEAFNKYFKL